MEYKIKLVSHACVFINLGEIKLLTDPWLFGECFNDGWSLKNRNTGKENISQKEIDKITHIWISHEHPDHFHFPSLKYIISQSKNPSNIEILCKQDLRTEQDILKTLKSIGFKKFRLLDHLEEYKLNKKISLRIYHHRHIDSALLLFNEDMPLLINLNDCEINPNECDFIKRRFGEFPILLNQFSIAGFNGIFSKKLISKEKDCILENMINQHKKLGASTTIPFASFFWFSSPDNKFLNQYHNTLEEVSKKFKKAKLNLYCLEPPSNFVNLKEIIKKVNYPSTELLEIDSSAEFKNIDNELVIQVIKKRISKLISISNKFIFYFFDSNLIFLI